mgnify:CR=1 FL=1
MYKNLEMTFSRKGYGRIFVEKEEDIAKVEAIMEEIDKYEFKGYYPTGKGEYHKVLHLKMKNPTVTGWIVRYYCDRGSSAPTVDVAVTKFFNIQKVENELKWKKAVRNMQICTKIAALTC